MSATQVIVLTNEEGDIQISRAGLETVIPSLKEFVKYARGYTEKGSGKIVYHDSRHFSSITIIGTASNIEQIDKNITKTDWDIFEEIMSFS